LPVLDARQAELKCLLGTSVVVGRHLRVADDREIQFVRRRDEHCAQMCRLNYGHARKLHAV
jgi:hypothetical protein